MHKFNKMIFHENYIFHLSNTGACEGTLTCSTCHLIFPQEVYDSLPDEPSEEELDMLELAQERGETYVLKVYSSCILFLPLKDILYANKGSTHKRHIL